MVTMTWHDLTDPGACLGGRCVEHHVGREIIPRDVPPAQGKHDFDYVAPDGQLVAVEVKMLVDPNYWQAAKEASRTGYTACDRLSLSWNIRVKDTAHYRSVQSHAQDLLAALEEHGIQQLDQLWPLRRSKPDLHARLERLHISTVWGTLPTDMHPPGYYVLPEGRSGGIPTIDLAIERVCEQLRGDWGQKLRDQLSSATHDRREAFIISGMERFDTHSLTDSEFVVPTKAPVLPEGVDGVWLTTTASGSHVVHWSSRCGWSVSRAPDRPAETSLPPTRSPSPPDS